MPSFARSAVFICSNFGNGASERLEGSGARIVAGLNRAITFGATDSSTCIVPRHAARCPPALPVLRIKRVSAFDVTKGHQVRPRHNSLLEPLGEI